MSKMKRKGTTKVEEKKKPRKIEVFLLILKNRKR